MTTFVDPPRICAECGGLESEHQHSPPGYGSDDGLPTFEGCSCKGYEHYDEDYPVYRCTCTGWDHEDDI